MRDNYGDKITVKCDGEEVHIAVDDHFRPGDESSIGALTPAKARKLAKKLKAAADEIDPPAPVAIGDEIAVGATVEIIPGDPYHFHPVGAVGTVTGANHPLYTVEVDGGGQLVKRTALKVLTETPAPVIVKTPRYALDLSVEEAETLAVILSRIGGSNGYRGTSARVYADSVAGKLASLGLDWLVIKDRPEYEVDETAARGGINFADFPIADDEPDSDPNEPRSGGCCGGVCG